MLGALIRIQNMKQAVCVWTHYGGSTQQALTHSCQTTNPAFYFFDHYATCCKLCYVCFFINNISKEKCSQLCHEVRIFVTLFSYCIIRQMATHISVSNVSRQTDNRMDGLTVGQSLDKWTDGRINGLTVGIE